MARTREQARWWAAKTQAEKKSALAQAYDMGDVKRAKLEGRYPPKDQLKDAPRD